MEFKNWLELQEARWRGPVGGAFGRDKNRMNQRRNQPSRPTPPTPQPGTPSAQPTPATPGAPAGAKPGAGTPATPASGREQNRFQGMSQRVDYGKGIEDQIYKGMESCGLKLRKPSGREDMIDKIDGWWDDGTQEHPVQIKYRDTGDDILFEVMKDYHGNIPGRDMIGKATHYAVLTRDGSLIRIVRVADAKAIIGEMQKRADEDGFDQSDSYRMPVKGGTAMLRIRPDPRSGNVKLMAYIPPSALETVKECPASIAFS
jgi:hypothetical protein